MVKLADAATMRIEAVGAMVTTVLPRAPAEVSRIPALTFVGPV